jgi:hypothetical protein
LEPSHRPRGSQVKSLHLDVLMFPGRSPETPHRHWPRTTAYPASTSTRKIAARLAGDLSAISSRWRARSSAFVKRRRRIERPSQSGTPLELADLSLVRTTSSLKNASASSCFLTAKARTGFRSDSMVKIESERESVISSPSVLSQPGRRLRISLECLAAREKHLLRAHHLYQSFVRAKSSQNLCSSRPRLGTWVAHFLFTFSPISRAWCP